MIMSSGRSAGGSDIRNVTINIADEKELEFIQGLQSLGMSGNVAQVITYLRDMKERSSREIEMATGLRQPEVSIAMCTLRKMGWIIEREIKGNGKGRPQRIYALRLTIDEVIKYCEAEKSQELARTMESLQRLKELSSV